MDNKDKTGKTDRDRINVNESYELRDWCKKLNVTEAQLRKAVDEVGPMVSDVEAFLKETKE